MKAELESICTLRLKFSAIDSNPEIGIALTSRGTPKGSLWIFLMSLGSFYISLERAKPCFNEFTYS